ncbi:MAG TPA: ribosome assembly RNA-binding protein YhbY [Desulfobulbus sp.]|nr:ribosome assembly RNA-binding protein YhbY [Desulfobulbus sp.]
MSTNSDKTPPTLNGKQKKHLRGLAHHLEPVVHVGREGLSESLIRSANQALLARELIKVKLGQNCPLARKEAARQIADRTGAALVQLIGRTIILFLPNPELPRDRRIHI